MPQLRLYILLLIQRLPPLIAVLVHNLKHMQRLPCPRYILERPETRRVPLR